MAKRSLTYTSSIGGIFWMIFMMLASFNSFAQSTVTGTITDEIGETLPGATVLVQGTSVGTITDLDGKYQGIRVISKFQI